MSVHNKLYVKDTLTVTGTDGGTFNDGGITLIGDGGISLSGGGVTLTSGNITLTGGGITLTNGDLTVGGNLTVDGDLTVSGLTTLVNTTNTEIKDNTILLNSGETGTGVGDGTGTSGIEIERGTETNNANLLFNETGDYWSVDNGDGTSYRLTELASTTAVTNTAAAFDGTGRLVASGDITNVTFNNITVSGTINQSVSTNITTTTVSIGNAINAFDLTTTNATATLPGTTGGDTFIIYLRSTTSATLTIVPELNGSIDNANNLVLDAEGQRVTLCSVGNGEWIIL